MKKANLEHQQSLVRLINYFLFQRFTHPKIRKDQTYKIGSKLVSFLESIVDGNQLADQEAAVKYFEKESKDFVLKSKKNERLNLLKCYGSSDIRVFNNLISEINLNNIKNTELEQNNDFKEVKIVNSLVFEKKIPQEIALYLKSHFANFLSFIPLQSNRLSLGQYNQIIENFGKNFTYDELLKKEIFTING